MKGDSPGVAPRLAAVRALAEVLARRAKAEVALERHAAELAPDERRLAHEILMGTLRNLFSLEADVLRFVRRRPPPAAMAALLAGAHQIRHMRVPPHAAVATSVEAVKRVHPSTAGMVNAVLRKLASSDPPERLEAWRRDELPEWIHRRWVEVFGPERVARMARVFRTPPPITLAARDRTRLCAMLADAGVAHHPGRHAPWAVHLDGQARIEDLPGYDRGEWLVMDEASQMVVAEGLEGFAGSRRARLVVDLCAAPGGKSALLAWAMPGARLVAVEPRRLRRLKANLERLGLSGRVQPVQADGMLPPIPDASADFVLVDAPCSASGIFRRRPDAKLMHTSGDLAELVRLQRALLKAGLRLLRPGGRLVYSVCSIHPEENEAVVKSLPGLVRCRRIFPDDEHDGFFVAVVERT